MVNLTADGAIFNGRVLRLLDDLDDAQTSRSTASAVPRGRLRVDVPSPLARMILMPTLPAFHARYPDIRIDMGVSDRIVDLIGEKVDCVVREGELTDPSLMARKVGDLQLGVFAAPGYLERLGEPVHPRDLEDSPQPVVGFLWARTGKALPYAMHNGNERIHIQGRYVLAVDDGNASLAAGLAGMGILWSPDSMSAPHVARGELVPLFEEWRLEPMPLYVAFPPNRHISLKLRVFIEWVAELMAQQAPVTQRCGEWPPYSQGRFIPDADHAPRCRLARVRAVSLTVCLHVGTRPRGLRRAAAAPWLVGAVFRATNATLRKARRRMRRVRYSTLEQSSLPRSDTVDHDKAKML